MGFEFSTKLEFSPKHINLRNVCIISLIRHVLSRPQSLSSWRMSWFQLLLMTSAVRSSAGFLVNTPSLRTPNREWKGRQFRHFSFTPVFADNFNAKNKFNFYSVSETFKQLLNASKNFNSKEYNSQNYEYIKYEVYIKP